jgi:hypothetical protein
MNDTTTNCNPTKLNHKTLKEAMELVKNFKDPLFEWMKAKGYGPDKGGMLIISTEMANSFGGLPLPFYVIMNNFMVENNKGNPLLINTFEHLLDVENLKPLFYRRVGCLKDIHYGSGVLV